MKVLIVNSPDTGYLQRNLNLCTKLTVLLALLFNKNSKFLDYAGGDGVFVRLMRDVGFDFYWFDKFSANLFSKGFEHNDDFLEYEALTTFESVEHFADPIAEIEKMLKLSKNIIFSTELLPHAIPMPGEWWYYGLDHGQHISFYSSRTFEFIASEYNLNYATLGSVHVLTEKKLPVYTQMVLKFTKCGLHKLIQRKLKSKTWTDYLQTSEYL